jgi:F-type H+-transporting ATPase subunit a
MPQIEKSGNAHESILGKPIVIAQGHDDNKGGEHKSEGTVGEAKQGEGAHTSEGHGGAHHPKPGDMPDPGLLFTNGILVVILLVVMGFIAKSKAERIPRGFQNLSESIAEGLNSFTIGIIGPEGAKHTPFIGTLFLYIAFMNYIGLVPGLHSPTANITTTLALGIIVFFYVQIEGIRNNGLGGHFSHLLGPKLGKYPLMAPLMLPIELLSELFRPFTLAIRLFGNIFGEDVILVVLAGLGLSMMGSQAASFIPFQFPIMLLACLTCLVQAMVFSTLTCIYLSLVAKHDHHDEHHGEEGHGHHAHAAGH